MKPISKGLAAASKSAQSSAGIPFAGHWKAPDFPSLEMLRAGIAAATLPYPSINRIEAIWLAMRAAATNVAIKRSARANEAATLAPSQDTLRLDCISQMGGFVAGMSNGAMAYRILTRNTWHPTLRAAIDEVVTETTKKNLKPREKQS